MIHARPFVLCIVLVASASVLGVGLPAQTTPLADLSGQIVDSFTGEPIEGVLVRADTGSDAFTDRRGRFRFVGLDAGSHLLAVLTSDCRVTWARIEMAAGVDRDLHLRLPPAFGAAAREARREEGERRRAEGKVLLAVEIDRMHARSVTELVQRLSPGMVGGGAGQAGATRAIRGRAPRSFVEDTRPILVVDGVRVPNVAATLDLMRPSEVEVLEVLPGAAAGWAYGSSGAFGVIRVTTRRGLATGATDELSPEECVVPSFPGR